MSQTTPAPESEGLWVVADVAKFLRASKSWVYHAAERGELPRFRVGAMLRFDPPTIRAWLANRMGRDNVVELRPKAETRLDK